MNVNNIDVNSLRFEFNKLIVKMKLTTLDDEIIISIGLSNPENKYNYENWFVKYGFIEEDGEITMDNKFIEQPLFNYYKGKLLVENSLSKFYDSLFYNIENQKRNDIEVQNKKVISGKRCEKLYFQAFIKLDEKRNMTQHASEIVKNRYDKDTTSKIINKCKAENLTIRFTNDISKARKVRIHL